MSRITLALAECADEPQKMLTRIEKEAIELERLIARLLSLARREIALCELLERVVADARFEGAAL